MAGQIRVGIIGASPQGGWGWRSHVPALQALPEYEIVAVCTAHEHTAAEAASLTGARYAFVDYRQLVALDEVDLVTVAVRVPWHREMSLAAIEAGKDVYCEWPLGINLAEVEEMAAAARKSGVRTVAGLQGRSAPWVEYLKTQIAEGFIGRPLNANARLMIGNSYMRAGIKWAAKRANGNHILSIQTAHTLDILSGCLGGFREVSAHITTTMPRWSIPGATEAIEADAPDSVMVRAKTGSGAVLSVHLANVPAHGSGWRLEVYGDRGTLIASSSGPPMLQPNRLQSGQADAKELSDLEVPPALIRVAADYPRDTSFHVAHAYKRLAEAIQSDSYFEPSFETALVLFRLLEVLERSDAEGGRWLTVE